MEIEHRKIKIKYKINNTVNFVLAFDVIFFTRNYFVPDYKSKLDFGLCILKLKKLWLI